MATEGILHHSISLIISLSSFYPHHHTLTFSRLIPNGLVIEVKGVVLVVLGQRTEPIIREELLW